jgi:hypothetical protein
MKWHSSFWFISLVTLLVLSGGCAGDKNAPHPTVQSAAPGKAKAADSAAATTLARRSVFTLDQNARDPFFPQAKKAALPVGSAVAAPTVITDLPALFTAGLQGIGGTPDHYIAIIHNVLLEKGRQTVISVRVGSQDRKFSVKCREVAKNSVALEVEGYGAMVIKPKQML